MGLSLFVMGGCGVRCCQSDGVGGMDVLLQCLLGGFGSVFPQHPIEHIHTPTPSWTGSYTTPPSWKPANTTCANTRPSGSRPPQKKKNRNGTGSVQRQARRCRPTITPVPFRNNTRYSNLQIITVCRSGRRGSSTRRI